MASKARIIIGIDPGTNVTGYGIISCVGKKMELLACGVVQMTRAEATHPQKLARIFTRVSSLIKAYKPDEMALEAPFYGKNPQSMLKLGRAQGVAMAAGLLHGLEIAEYAPKKVKSAVTGTGLASKEQVAAMLRRMLQFEEEPQFLDATDGLAVAVCHFFQGKSVAKGGKSKDWGAFLKANPDRIKGK